MMVVRLALRQLRHDAGRSALTCLGIAGVVAVILFLQGFREGLDTQLRRVAMDRGADLIATQEGVRNMIGARSVIPQMVRGAVEDMDGVATAHPMTALPIIYSNRGRRSPIFLFVVDSIGGPRTTLEGDLPRREGQILIDRSIARMFDLGPGDAFEVAGYTFEVSGVTRATSALWTPFAFVSFDSLLEFYFEADLADDISAFPLLSYLLIEVEPGRDARGVAGRLEAAVPDIDIYLPDEIGRNDEALGRTMLGALIGLLIGVAYAAGLLVVALFMYTAAEARQRDLGILKALGFPPRSVALSVAIEVAVLVATAIPIGIVVAMALAALTRAVMPVYLVLPVEPGPLFWVIAGCTLFAVIGGLAPWTLVRRLDAHEVFQS